MQEIYQASRCIDSSKNSFFQAHQNYFFSAITYEDKYLQNQKRVFYSNKFVIIGE